MTIERHKRKSSVAYSQRKGKYATSTENRRLMWEYVVWPLVLKLNRNYFTPQEYHDRRDQVAMEKNIQSQKWLEVWYLFWLKELSSKMGNTIRFISN